MNADIYICSVEDNAVEYDKGIPEAFVFDREKIKRYLQVVEDSGGFDVCRAADPNNCRIHHTGKYGMNRLGMKLSNGVGRVKSFLQGKPYVQEARDLSKSSQNEVDKHFYPLSDEELDQLSDIVGVNRGKASDRIYQEMKKRRDRMESLKRRREEWYPSTFERGDIGLPASKSKYMA